MLRNTLNLKILCVQMSTCKHLTSWSSRWSRSVPNMGKDLRKKRWRIFGYLLLKVCLISKTRYIRYKLTTLKATLTLTENKSKLKKDTILKSFYSSGTKLLCTEWRKTLIWRKLFNFWMSMSHKWNIWSLKRLLWKSSRKKAFKLTFLNMLRD